MIRANGVLVLVYVPYAYIITALMKDLNVRGIGSIQACACVQYPLTISKTERRERWNNLHGKTNNKLLLPT